MSILDDAGFTIDLTEGRYRAATTTIRDWAIAGLPILYVLGFITWSTYAIGQGLGFLVLSAPHYLASGFFVALFLVLGAFSETIFWVIIPIAVRQRLNSRGIIPGAKLVGLRAANRAISAAIASFVMWELGLTFKIFSFLWWELAVLAIAVGLLLSIIETLIILACRARPNLFGEISGLFLIPVDQNVDIWQVAKKSGSWALIAITCFSAIALPAMEPEFGGAKPRLALLELDPGDFDNRTQGLLFGNYNDSNTSAFIRTTTLSVYYSGDSFFLVRAGADANGRSPLIEIPRSIIHSVIWIT